MMTMIRYRELDRDFDLSNYWAATVEQPRTKRSRLVMRKRVTREIHRR